MENSSREHKREGIKANNCQRSPSSTQKSGFSSLKVKPYTAPLKEKQSVPDDLNEFGNIKRQDSWLTECQPSSVDPTSAAVAVSVRTAGSDAESTKSPAGRLSPPDKLCSKMCEPPAAGSSPEVTPINCDKNTATTSSSSSPAVVSPIISQSCQKTAVAVPFNSPAEPIVTECFGKSTFEDSRSSVITPCYSSSVTNSVAPESLSSKDSDCDDSITKKKSLPRKLFSPSKPDYDVSVENQIRDDTIAKNHSLEFLNEMKKKLSQEIAAHNKRQQDEDCVDTAQLVDIYPGNNGDSSSGGGGGGGGDSGGGPATGGAEEEELVVVVGVEDGEGDYCCSNDSIKDDLTSRKTYSPPQPPPPGLFTAATTQHSDTEFVVDLEKDDVIMSDDDDVVDEDDDDEDEEEVEEEDVVVIGGGENDSNNNNNNNNCDKDSDNENEGREQTLNDNNVSSPSQANLIKSACSSSSSRVLAEAGLTHANNASSGPHSKKRTSPGDESTSTLCTMNSRQSCSHSGRTDNKRRRVNR